MLNLMIGVCLIAVLIQLSILLLNVVLIGKVSKESKELLQRIIDLEYPPQIHYQCFTHDYRLMLITKAFLERLRLLDMFNNNIKSLFEAHWNPFNILTRFRVGKEKIERGINDYELKCKVGFFDNGKKKTRV